MPKRRASKLVLTNQRVLEFKRGFIKETSKDFTLNEIASIEHKKGYIMRKITLEVQGVSSKYQTLENFGRAFVTAVREQAKRYEEGGEPIDPPSATGHDDSDEVDGEAPTSREVPSKYGSLKTHIIIAILTIWWTFGVGNAIYAGYSYYKFEK